MASCGARPGPQLSQVAGVCLFLPPEGSGPGRPHSPGLVPPRSQPLHPCCLPRPLLTHFQVGHLDPPLSPGPHTAVASRPASPHAPTPELEQPLEWRPCHLPGVKHCRLPFVAACLVGPGVLTHFPNGSRLPACQLPRFKASQGFLRQPQTWHMLLPPGRAPIHLASVSCFSCWLPQSLFRGYFLTREPLLLSQVTGPITGTGPCFVALDYGCDLGGDYVSPVPGLGGREGENARDTSSPPQPPGASHRPANIQYQTLPRLLLTSSWKDSDWWEEQTRINKASREGLFRRSCGPAGSVIQSRVTL